MNGLEESKSGSGDTSHPGDKQWRKVDGFERCLGVIINHGTWFVNGKEEEESKVIVNCG